MCIKYIGAPAYIKHLINVIFFLGFRCCFGLLGDYTASTPAVERMLYAHSESLEILEKLKDVLLFITLKQQFLYFDVLPSSFLCLYVSFSLTQLKSFCL